MKTKNIGMSADLLHMSYLNIIALARANAGVDSLADLLADNATESFSYCTCGSKSSDASYMVDMRIMV